MDINQWRKWQTKTWIEAWIPQINCIPNRHFALAAATVVNNHSQLHDVTNEYRSNTKKLLKASTGLLSDLRYSV